MARYALIDKNTLIVANAIIADQEFIDSCSEFWVDDETSYRKEDLIIIESLDFGPGDQLQFDESSGTYVRATGGGEGGGQGQ